MLKKLFTNDRFFAAAAGISVIASIAALVLFLLAGDFASEPGGLYLVGYVLLAVCVSGLYFSYQKHDKNVMKGLMGVLLATLLLTDCYSLEAVTYHGYAAPYLELFLIALDLVLMINHFILNSDHGSRPGNILINQVAASILALTNLAELGIMVGLSADIIGDLRLALGSGAAMLAYLFAFVSIVCVESRLDLYKSMRKQ